MNLGLVQDATLNEKSGLVFGTHLWTHEDGGNPSALYAIDPVTGKVRGAFPLQYANADTEDISLFYPRSTVLRLALFVNGSRSIVVVDEPKLDQPYTANMKTWTVIAGWPPKGCEAAFFDINGDAYLFEKYAATPGDTDRALIRIPAEQFATSTTVTGTTVAQLKFPAPVDTNPQPSAADITRDGKIIMVAMQAGLCLYERAPGKSVADALNGPALFLPPPANDGCGEAACFSPDGRTIFHVGERPEKLLRRRDRLDIERTVTITLRDLLPGRTYAYSAQATSGDAKSSASGTFTT